MTNLLYRLGIPIGGTAVLCGAAWWVQKMGFLPKPIAYHLWTIVLLLILAGATALAAMWNYRLWLWPLGVGLGMQLIGLLLRISETFALWEDYWFTFGSMLLVLLIMGGVFLFNSMRARTLEKRLAEGMAEGIPGNQEELGRIRKDMMEALSLLRRAGKGRNAIYELPWYLVMGRPAAGKTVAIKNSGLGLPVRRDRVKGDGGTFTCDWFFTDHLIFLDTPGRWVLEGTDDETKKLWNQVLKLLKKYRGRRPLDGLVVVVPADDLLSCEDEELEEQAANAREVVELMHAELGFRFPIYLLVTKSDLVDGFVDFFKGLPAQRRQEIFGWSNPDTADDDAVGIVQRGFGDLARHLETYRLEMLGRVAKKTQARKLFFFPEEFKALERPLQTFADAFFGSDRYRDAPVFRGFYFTSGTQGEGVPLSTAMTGIARTLGVSSDRPQESSEGEPKRSYFLLELFRELMVGDDGLVGKTAGQWWRQRRNTLFGVFAPAAIALLVLLFAAGSFLGNRSIYKTVERDVPEIVTELEKIEASPVPNPVRALELTGRLADYHQQLAKWHPFRSLGMRRPGALADTVRAQFHRGFQDAVLVPTLRKAEASARSLSDCIGRLETLHAVVYLRQGRPGYYSGEMEFSSIWDAPEDELAEFQAELTRQYGYYKDTAGTPMLPGFSLATVANDIRRDCSDQGSASALYGFLMFQRDCQQASGSRAKRGCFEKLTSALDTEEVDYERLSRRYRQLETDLQAIQDSEEEAGAALGALESIDIGEGGASLEECLTKFKRDVRPLLRDYADTHDLVDDCEAAVKHKDDADVYAIRSEKSQALRARLGEKRAELESAFDDFNDTCKDAFGGLFLDYHVLSKTVVSDLFERCSPRARNQSTQWTKGPVSKPADTVWLEVDARVDGDYTRSAWEEKKSKWVGLFQLELSEEEKNGYKDDIDRYTTKYVSTWQDYVSSLGHKKQADALNWLRGLGETDEFERLVGKAEDNLDLNPQGADPASAAMARALRDARDLKQLMKSIERYQQLIKQVADDLAEFSADPAVWGDYRRKLASNDSSIALVQAYKLASESDFAALGIEGVFKAPLDSAAEFVRSDNYVANLWGQMAKLYQQEIQDAAPFSKAPDAELVSEESLKELLGAKDGQVVQLRKLAEGENLSETAEQWLSRAERLSKALFRAGTNELKRYRVRVEIGEEQIDPPKQAKNLQVNQLTIMLSSVDEFSWNAESPSNAKALSFQLFGEEHSEVSAVKGALGERRGFFARKVGRNFNVLKKPALTTAGDQAEVNASLAPLKLFEMGLDGKPPSSPLRLQFVLKAEAKGDKEPAKAIIPITVTAPQVSELMKLLDEGLGAPPSSPLAGG